MSPQPDYNPEPTLTPREREIIILLGQGRSNIQVARYLGLKRRTVETHLMNARQKFDAFNTLHLIVLALFQGLITLEELCHKSTSD